MLATLTCSDFPRCAETIVYEQEKDYFAPCCRKTHGPQNRSLFVEFSASLHTAQILVFKFNFAINRASPWVKLMTLDVRSSAPLFIWLWPMKYGHWETTSRKKCLLHPKNITSYNLRRTDFQKAPLRAFKSTPFTCLSGLFAFCASAR